MLLCSFLKYLVPELILCKYLGILQNRPASTVQVSAQGLYSSVLLMFWSLQ